MARPRQFDEDQVIDQVTRTFWERGYANTSIADLETATGLGRQSLYCAFGDKHALFVRALERYATLGERHMPVTAFSSAAPLEQLRCMLRATIDTATAPDAPGACLMVQAMTEFGTTDAEVLARCRANSTRIETWVGRLIEQAAAVGALAPGLTPATVTTLVMAQHFGIPILARSGVPAAQLQSSVDLLLQQITS
ncbi:MAG TPA: TetR/AcrR family transcriptional regulator [Gemmatimonas aurantiaca]|uniref:TetR family transcriptional regulator n=2 Tax=Gemmatimonas aurantiaca TaxID=173480 RepID=C1A3N1_GEMAT|nr:TetR/AcrR family transcriptional regulator [Gemmatimonas aurantiaca]BAH37108.1 TetR family transcriptional regulator [Gemmatimonas aurantiaca T-27]HCT58859.1 TetR/AcrR family transcriptional regulator [Gemmatimonas aurantiaca]